MDIGQLVTIISLIAVAVMAVKWRAVAVALKEGREHIQSAVEDYRVAVSPESEGGTQITDNEKVKIGEHAIEAVEDALVIMQNIDGFLRALIGIFRRK